MELSKLEPFNGFGPEGFEFLVGLALDNSRSYFQNHRDVYDRALRLPFEAMLRTLADEFGGTPKMFRPHRDVRFSADKSPYKTNVAGYLAGAGTLYVEFSVKGVLAATGYYSMSKEQLARYRAVLTSLPGAEEHARDLEARLAELCGFDMMEEDALKTVPRGFAKDHPFARLLRLKSITIAKTLPPDRTHDGERVLEHVREVWRAGRPLNAWLDEHVGGGTFDRTA
jgi:uncharacterized protein (TIGR02453 family)